MIPPGRALRRLSNRRSGELGLTLIELLLSLALVAVLVSFLVGGLSMAKRAFAVDLANSIDADSDGAIESVTNLVAGTLPALRSDQSVAFDGRPDRVRFVALSEGRALRGGPYRVDLRQVGNELMVEVSKWGVGAAQDREGPATSAVTVLRGVRVVHFAYFGTLGDPGSQPGWRKEWRAAQTLPQLISLRIEFEDGRRNGPTSIIALRNG